MNEKNMQTGNEVGRYRPAFCLYHPNSKGTGCAIKMDLHPAHDLVDGCIMLKAANQVTIGNRQGPVPVFPRFAWENSICVKLDFNDLSGILQVLRGECESVGGGRGLYHQSAKAATKIMFRHVLEPESSYSLDLYRSFRDGKEESHAHFVLNATEAMGLCESISGSMSLICFGIPMLVPHDTTAYRAEAREVAREEVA